MTINPSSYYNLVERIEEAFAEIGSDTVTELAESNDDYAVIKQESTSLMQNHPIIEKTLDGDGAISLTADEHKALACYINLTREMENIERQQIYFRGHTDCFAYLKRIGVI